MTPLGAVRFRIRGSALIPMLFGVAFVLSMSACEGDRAADGTAVVETGVAVPPMVICDGRTLTDLNALAGASRDRATELEPGIQRAILGVVNESDSVMAYEYVRDGRTSLALRELESGRDRLVSEDLVRVVGFSSAGELWYIARDGTGGQTMTLASYDLAHNETTTLDRDVIDARVDADSSAIAYTRATSEVEVDPVETEMVFIPKRGAKPITVDTFENAAFADIGMVTPEAVLYVRNSGAGEAHGDVRVFDVEKAKTAVVASASRIAATSPDRNAVVLAAYAMRGDVIVDQFGGVAADDETIHIGTLDGADFTQREVPGEPIIGHFLQAAFVGDSDHIVVVANNPSDGNDAVYYLDMLSGTQRRAFETSGEGISEVLPLPDDGRVVCVVASYDRGADAFCESIVILSLDDPDAEPVRIDGSTGSTLDIVGVPRAKGGG